MPDSSFRVGLLGWGNAGRFFHTPLIQVTSGLELAAVVTSREMVKSELPEVEVYGSAEDLLAEPDIDLVVVATPHRLHRAHARAALEAGKHVVVEKPFVATATEAENLIEQARSADRILTVFQNRRWDGDFMTLRKLIDSKILGHVHYFASHWYLYRPEPRGVWRDHPDNLGGILYDLGPHMIDQALQLFGKPETVYAQVEINRASSRVDDWFRIHLRFPSDVHALLETDLLVQIPAPRFHIRGQFGTYEKHGLDPQEVELRAGKLPTNEEWGVEEPSHWGTLRGVELADMMFDGKVATLPGDYRIFYRKLYEALTGNGPPPVNPEDVVVQLRVIAAAIRSAETNTVYLLD